MPSSRHACEPPRARTGSRCGWRALREAAFVDAARRLASAARESVDAVRDELARAARVAAPAVDGVLVYEQRDAELRCVAAFGDRFAYFAGTSVALDDTSALPARAIAAGHRATLDDANVLKLHPTDVAALAVPLALDAGRACALVVAAQQPLDAGAVERLVTLADQAAPAYSIALDREHDRRTRGVRRPHRTAHAARVSPQADRAGRPRALRR